ncbi:MAG: hypothetical protein HDT38_01875 [Clostridiales bacterium]|nr:hypothetical protein [Clostridiales bacterium]
MDQELKRYEREKFNEKLIQTTDLSSYLDLPFETDSGYTVIISAKDDAVSNFSAELREKCRTECWQYKQHHYRWRRKGQKQPRLEYCGIWTAPVGGWWIPSLSIPVQTRGISYVRQQDSDYPGLM